MSTLHSEKNKSVEELEQELALERAKFQRDAFRLEKSLSPSHFADQAIQYARQNGAQLADNFVGSITNNPVPALLTAIGVIWMMSGSRSQHHASYSATYGEEFEDIYGYDWEDPAWGAETSANFSQNSADKSSAGGNKLKDKAEQVKEGASHLGHEARRRAALAKQKTQHAIASGYRGAKRQAHQYSDQVSHLFQDNPLMLAVTGVALGAAVGAALPRTDTEDRAFAQVGRQLKDRAKQAASEIKHEVKDRMDSATDAAKSSLRNEEYKSSQSSNSPSGATF